MQLSQNATEKRGAQMVAFRGPPPVVWLLSVRIGIFGCTTLK